MILNFSSSWLHFPNAEITAMHHYAWFARCSLKNLGVFFFYGTSVSCLAASLAPRSRLVGVSVLCRERCEDRKQAFLHSTYTQCTPHRSELHREVRLTNISTLLSPSWAFLERSQVSEKSGFFSLNSRERSKHPFVVAWICSLQDLGCFRRG